MSGISMCNTGEAKELWEAGIAVTKQARERKRKKPAPNFFGAGRKVSIN
jgi:hypothetical protein